MIEPVRALASCSGISRSTAEGCRMAHRPDAADGSTGAAAHAHTHRAMGWPHVRDQGLAGLVLQLLQGGSTDADRQGYSCGEGCAYGPGFQMAGAFSTSSTRSFGRSSAPDPGCTGWPAHLRPLPFFHSGGMKAGPSLGGGLEELRVLRPTRSRKLAPHGYDSQSASAIPVGGSPMVCRLFLRCNQQSFCPQGFSSADLPSEFSRPLNGYKRFWASATTAGKSARAKR
jgi:hypothetical protein